MTAPGIIKYEWKCLANEQIGRSSFDLVSIGSNVFLYGGELKPRVPFDSEMYTLDVSLAEPVWVKLASNGDAPRPRVASTMAVVGDIIYLFGGREEANDSTALNDFFEYNTVTRTWGAQIAALGGSVPAPRSYHKMTAIGHEVYVFGGCSQTGRLNDLHVFDTITKVWKVLPTNEQISPRGGPNFAASSLGSLIVVAGYSGNENDDIFVYQVSSKEWSTRPPGQFRARSVCASTAMLDGHVLAVFGGEVNSSDLGHQGAGDFDNNLMFINIQTGIIIPSENVGSRVPTPRGWNAMSAIASDKTRAVLFGGLTGNDANPVRLGDTWLLTLL